MKAIIYAAGSNYVTSVVKQFYPEVIQLIRSMVTQSIVPVLRIFNVIPQEHNVISMNTFITSEVGFEQIL